MFQETLNTYSANEYLAQKYSNYNVDDLGQVIQYTNFEEEYLALKYGAGIFNSENYKLIALYGKENKGFLNRISTNKIDSLSHYNKIDTLFLNDKARLIDKSTVIFLDDYLMLNSSNNIDLRLIDWLERYIIMEKIKVDDVSSKYFHFTILGPQAESFLTLIAGDVIESLNDSNIIRVYDENIKCFIYKDSSIPNVSKYVVFGPKQEELNTIKILLNSTSVLNVKMVGQNAFNAYRCFSQIPAFPNEINDKFNPYDLNLMDLVNGNKGCYIGQEVVARLDTYDKAQKQLVRFECEQLLDISSNLLYDENYEVIGEITSWSKIPFRNRTLGLIVIKKNFMKKTCVYVKCANDFEKVKIKAS